MFLLFEWTEEREAKMHIGIYSTEEKAKAAAQLAWANELKDRGAEPHEVGNLEWKSDGGFLTGWKRLADGADEDLVYVADADCPYDVEALPLDFVLLHQFPGPVTTRVEV